MVLLVIYVAGVVIGLIVMRDPWPVRVGTALVWPVGPAAFVLVVSGLLVAAMILWPLIMIPAAALLGAVGWWMT
jgi:hypothetical protein